jgi:hypothetical protein
MKKKLFILLVAFYVLIGSMSFIIENKEVKGSVYTQAKASLK